MNTRNDNAIKIIERYKKNTEICQLIRKQRLELVSEKSLVKLNDQLLKNNNWFATQLYQASFLTVHDIRIIISMCSQMNFNIKELIIINCSLKVPKLINITPNSLRLMIFNNSNLKEKDLQQIVRLIKYSTSLKRLEIIYNVIPKAIFKELSQVLKKSHLKALKLNYNQLEPECMAFCNELIKSSTDLKQLNLSNNNLKTIGLDYLSTGFLFNQNLTHLNLSGNNIDYDGITKLSLCLQKNLGIKYLILNENKITNLGLNYLLRCIKEHRLLYLSLQFNNLKYWDQFKDTKLKALDLSNNLLDDDCIAMLLADIQSSGLDYLNLDYNRFSNTKIKEIIQSDHQIQVLHLRTHSEFKEKLNIIKNFNLKLCSLNLGVSYKYLESVLSRNISLNENRNKASIQLLNVCRVIYQTLNNPITLLPNFVLRKLLRNFDPFLSLTSRELTNIIVIASDKRTLIEDGTVFQFWAKVFEFPFNPPSMFLTNPNLLEF